MTSERLTSSPADQAIHAQPPGSPRLSVIVVAYRQHEPLVQCLQAIVAAATPLQGGIEEDGVEVIVVDNGALAPLVRECCPRAHVLEPTDNLGFAGGAQLGIEAARGEWVALVNDDATLDPDALAALVCAGQRDARIGSVAAQIRFAGAPTRVNSAGIDVDSLGVATERLAGRPVAEAQGEAHEVFGASACVALYRASMLHVVGGLDPSFFAYQEDVDLAWRARAAGWTAIYEPSAIAYHRGSASSGEGSRMKYHLVGRNRARLLARNATTGQLLRGLPGMLCYDLAYVAYVAASDHTLAPLQGRLRGLRQWRHARAQTRGRRREVALSSAWEGWRAALRQHVAYRAATRIR